MTQLASDNFTRANSTGLGANWTGVTGSGTLDISSNSAIPHTITIDAAEYYNAVSWPTSGSQYSEIVVKTPGSPGVDLAGVGPIVYAAAGSNNYYRAFATGPSGNFHLDKVTGGSGVSLGTFAGSVANGDVIRLTIIGAVLTVTKNGTTVITATDSSSPFTSGSAGICYSSQDSNVDAITSWLAGTVPASSGLFPRQIYIMP